MGILLGAKIDAAKAKISGDTRAEGAGIRAAINALPAKINLLPGDSRSEGKSPTLKTTVLVSPYGVGRATTTAALSGHLGSRAS